ncbi:hypothetical protein AB0L65_20345 [Nonomuraea sp. NPDC052116]|uniref:hypothetical protein n=1 Tax=Nonomuraea sp. NPDC052116 TaxID=3155665 RepID=UPI003445612F
MNPIMAVSMERINEAISHHDEAVKLITLRDRLAEIGVHAELRDNNSALMVVRPDGALPVWVFVGYGGAFYSWDNTNKRHPTDDPQGAASTLAEYVKGL